ncbi:NPCBM/NEW2 domain-containing protein [Neobacillus sp. YIM B06451]|uniref:NPCBM/NEW2 domain-containing protein n=1 Tax=Neobacillus sp. YIM B06451 TaxID=3070994 RepID=UPI00292E9365|nr:NPCBM/NEW2 domain-containing protein [Neobacillus sp. YIM B06451]
MKKRSLVFLVVISFVFGTLFSSNVTEAASESISSLQKQIKSLQTTVASQKKQIATKDKQISDLKKQVAAKSKEADSYKSYAVTPLKTKIAYKGNIQSGNFQTAGVSVPRVLAYKGIMYAPVNAVGDLLGDKAFYNKTVDTVFFGTNLNGSYMSDILKPYYATSTVNTNKTMQIAGKTYTKGYSMEFYYSDGADKYSLNLDGKYSKITGLIGIDDNSRNNYDTNIEIVGDGEVLASVKLTQGGLPSNVDVDIAGVKKLEVVKADNKSGWITIDLANVVIK